MLDSNSLLRLTLVGSDLVPPEPFLQEPELTWFPCLLPPLPALPATALARSACHAGGNLRKTLFCIMLEICPRWCCPYYHTSWLSLTLFTLVSFLDDNTKK